MHRLRILNDLKTFLENFRSVQLTAHSEFGALKFMSNNEHCFNIYLNFKVMVIGTDVSRFTVLPQNGEMNELPY